MPEGDTIHRSAALLGRVLTGHTVTRYRAWRPELLFPDRTGRRVLGVEARGKNLLVHFDDRRVLWSHMRMSGVWHVYGGGERWRRPAHRARVEIGTDRGLAVCFSAPRIELMSKPALARHPLLSTLGPDLLAPEPDLAEALRRLQGDPGQPLGEALLDQRRVAGIGNVYKSEMLFLERLDPFAPAGAVPPERLAALLAATRRMMQRNLGPRPRRTREGPGSRLWVYERDGLGCHRCHTRIAARRQGPTGRTTWWCPGCQAGASLASGRGPALPR